MATYIILSRFSPEAFREPGEFKKSRKQCQQGSKASVRERFSLVKRPAMA
jgi:hypothetical protein